MTDGRVPRPSARRTRRHSENGQADSRCGGGSQVSLNRSDEGCEVRGPVRARSERHEEDQPAGPSPVRVGVWTDVRNLLGWQLKLLISISHDPRYTLTHMLDASDDRPATAEQGWGGRLWKALDRLEAGVARRRFTERWASARHDANEADDIDDVVPVDAQLLERIAPGLERRQVGSTIPAEVLTTLNLDVVLCFGHEVPGTDVITAARHGAWSIEPTNDTIARGGPAGFWEVADRREFTGAQLRQHRPDGTSAVVRRASYVTVRSSWNETRRRASAKSILLVLDALEELATFGQLHPIADSRPLRVFDRAVKGNPGPLAVARMIGLTASTTLRSAIDHRRRPGRWRILVNWGAIEGRSLSEMIELVAPPGRYWADPFVVTRDGRTLLFFEDLDLTTGRGRISTTELTRDGHGPVDVVMEPDHHLSYPFLVTVGDDLYMIPESCEAREVALWRCVESPAEWHKVRVLLPGLSAVDTSVIYRDERWWIFTSIDRSGFGDHADELHLFWTDDLLNGALVAHPRNPIVADPRIARMAGSFITASDGTLYRPAQVGGWHYGVSLKFMRVDRLDAEGYTETLVESVGPNWSRHREGIHHACSTPDVTVFDVCVRDGLHRPT